MLEVATDAFGGIPAFLLALPWSYLMFLIIESVIPSANISIASVTIIIILGALINTILLIYGFSWTKVLKQKANQALQRTPFGRR